ncbi:hypothetical protein HF521_008982, partial [Silurus meridionalis]
SQAVSSYHIIKFTDDTTVVGLISKNKESAYKEEVQLLTAWCGANNLSLKVDKTKEMVVDFRKAHTDHSPLIIDGSSMENVKNTRFLGVHLAKNFTWSLNTSSITKKAQQRLFFLRSLRKACLSLYPDHVLQRDHSEHPEQLHHCLVWELHSWTAEKIIGVSLPYITDIYTTHCIHKANRILDNTTHPHTHFSPSYHQKSGSEAFRLPHPDCATVSSLKPSVPQYGTKLKFL